MIGYTLPEIRRLLTKLILRVTDAAKHVWAWSRWRCRRQVDRFCAGSHRDLRSRSADRHHPLRRSPIASAIGRATPKWLVRMLKKSATKDH
jgi:hypothetical protein